VNKTSRIFTHGGKAHADEVLAAALLIAARPDLNFSEIIRDENRIGEAKDNDFVVGCGEKYDKVRFFDSPHREREKDENVELHCASTLVAKVFAPTLFFDEKFGPLLESVRAYEDAGIPAESLTFDVITGLFEKMPLSVANELSKSFRKRLEGINAATEWIKANTHIERVFKSFNILVEDKPHFDGDFSDGEYKTALNNYMYKKQISVSYEWSRFGKCILRKGEFGGAYFDFTKAAPKNTGYYRSISEIVFDPADETEYRSLIAMAAGCEIYDGKVMLPGVVDTIFVDLDDFLKVFWCDFFDNKNKEV
jgi:hypothetical protein